MKKDSHFAFFTQKMKKGKMKKNEKGQPFCCHFAFFTLAGKARHSSYTPAGKKHLFKARRRAIPKLSSDLAAADQRPAGLSWQGAVAHQLDEVRAHPRIALEVGVAEEIGASALEDDDVNIAQRREIIL
ncbi:MAG: hypothetical protein N838_23995 [Thiohalocapsa sp. PB-PSB1]|jgi:hypothetical protein|nr:MAG: hypothetical protein N838_23995 [Thiohalocapsa sp. PB-PSB1]